MVRTIPKRIISIILIAILSFTLCLAVPKYQVKASIVGGMTVEIGLALIALLGAFGITIELPDNLSDDEFLSAIGTVLPINKTYAEWRENIAITEEGKIFASQDLVNQLLTRFYSGVNTFNVEFNPVSALSGASVSYHAIDTRNLNVSQVRDTPLFSVGDEINYSQLKYMNGSNFYNYLYLHRSSFPSNITMTEKSFSSLKDYLTNPVHQENTGKYYYFTFGMYQNMYVPYLYVLNIRSLFNLSVSSISRYYHVYRYYLIDSLTNSDTSIVTTRYIFLPDGNVRVSSYNFSYLCSGFNYLDNYSYLSSNLGTYGSYVFLSQGAVLNRFWDVTNRSLLTDRIYSYIGSCVGLSIVQSATATDTITIGLQDDAIDYPLSGTGVVVDTGVIAQDLDGWVEGVQEKVVTRDIPSESESTRTSDFEISKVIASPTALDFTDTADYAAEESLPATYSANTNITLLNGIGSFFPFCIPFDLYEIFNGLNAPAQVPRFNWSIDFRSFGMGKHDFVIDLSDFATVCLIFKILTFIGFLIFLTLKTRDLIRG